MKYVLGDSISINSTHPSDEGTSITVMDNHTLPQVSGCTSTLILQEGSRTAVLIFEGEYNKNLLLEYLRVYPPEQKLQLALGNDNWLSVSYDNRGEPYTRGLLVSVGASLYSDRPGGSTVSVFIEERDVCLLVRALRGQPCGT